MTWYIGSRTYIHAHVSLILQHHATPSHTSIVECLLLLRILLYVSICIYFGRVRISTALKFVQDTWSPSPRNILRLPQSQGFHQGNMSSRNMCYFCITSLKENHFSWTLYLLRQPAWHGVNEPKSNIQTKQHPSRGQRNKTEGSWVLRWPQEQRCPLTLDHLLHPGYHAERNILCK